MIARVFEEEGLSTTIIALVKEHAAKVKPPRALAVSFPYGSALGRANDPAFQHKVIAASLDLLKHDSAPVLAEFPDDGEGPATMLQASAIQVDAARAIADPADEVTSLRTFYERWVDDHESRTQVGLSGIPQRRFRGMIRFLQDYTTQGGGNGDAPDRPADVPLPLFIRWFIDDLKAFYYEARMNQHPGVKEDDLHHWFWGETAMGKLVVDIGKLMDSSEDPDVKGTAFGISR